MTGERRISSRHGWWKENVASTFYTESCCDWQPSNRPTGEKDVQLFVCDLCQPNMAFATKKGLASHTQAKHKIKTDVRLYVSDSCCPVCNTDFRHRARVLKHLGDTRRPCRQKLFTGEYAMMIESEATKLDEADRTLRRQFWRAGHTSILATAPAMKNGKAIGRCTRC